MIKDFSFPLLRDPLARDGEVASDNTDTAAAAGAAAGATGSDAETGQAAAAAGLLTGKKTESPAGAGAGEEFSIPEKFLIKGEDGKPNWEQVAKKALPGYLELEKRLGAGEAPPESADKYKIDNYLPEGFERNPEAEKAVLARIHDLKLNNKQAQGVLSFYGELLGQGLAAEKTSMEAATTGLKESWGKEYERNMNRANFALTTLAAPELVAQITSDARLMNHTAVIQLLATMGAELEDDRAANQMSAGDVDDIDALRRSKAYLDEKDPEHKRVREKVSAAYAKGYKDKHQ